MGSNKDDLTLYRVAINIFQQLPLLGFKYKFTGYRILTLVMKHEIVFDHGEGKVVGLNIDKFRHLVAFSICDFNGNATLNVNSIQMVHYWQLKD